MNWSQLYAGAERERTPLTVGPRLARHFTQHFARRMGRRIETIPTAVMDALVRYAWPGNIREMQNVIERAVILSPGPALQVPLRLHVAMEDEKVRHLAADLERAGAL